MAGLFDMMFGGNQQDGLFGALNQPQPVGPSFGEALAATLGDIGAASAGRQGGNWNRLQALDMRRQQLRQQYAQQQRKREEEQRKLRMQQELAARLDTMHPDTALGDMVRAGFAPPASAFREDRPSIGTPGFRDFTVDSLAEYQQTGDPAVLKRITPAASGGSRGQSRRAGGGGGGGRRAPAGPTAGGLPLKYGSVPSGAARDAEGNINYLPGSKQHTDAQQELDTLMAGRDAILDMKADIKEHGSEMFGKDAATMRARYGELMRIIADLQNMGVMQAGEVEMVQSQLPDPSTWGASVTGNESMLAAYDQLQKRLDRRLSDARSQYAPMGLETYKMEDQELADMRQTKPESRQTNDDIRSMAAEQVEQRKAASGRVIQLNGKSYRMGADGQWEEI